MEYFFPHEVGVCAYLKQVDIKALRKWLAWYRRRGVGCFYLYVDGDISTLRSELQAQSLAGNVVLISFSVGQAGNERIMVYEDCLLRVRYFCRYLALLEVGEYLDGLGEESLPGLFGKCFAEFTGALEVNGGADDKRYVVNPLCINGFGENGELLLSIMHRLRSVKGLYVTRQRKKRIALLSHVMARNGAPLALLNAAKILKEAGYELDVYAAARGPLEKDFQALGIKVVIDTSLQGIPLVDQPWYHGYELIFVNTAVMVGCFSKRLDDVPAIWWLHESKSILDMCEVTEDKIARLHSEHLNVFGVSEVANNDFLSIASLVPLSGILTLGVEDAFNGKKRNRGKEEPLVFMMCGAWESRKGQDILLKAIGELKTEEREKCEFWIVGGECSNTTEKYRAELERMSSLYQEVKIMGLQPHEKVISLYENVDVVVVPSREESLSIVAIEAMMMNASCLLSDNVGVASAVKSGKAGLIFKNGNSTELAEKISFLINNPDKIEEMGNNGRLVYERIFTNEEFSKRLMKVVEGCLKK